MMPDLVGGVAATSLPESASDPDSPTPIVRQRVERPGSQSDRLTAFEVVGAAGFEPATSCV
jgi:hypothetical protein